ncbi:muts domain V-domain-containing protein [Gaertneriomyces semiglobifer]|nr:muts domain V-domain-containing protein [Gaertneriomyces semiglobifer]
MALQYTSPDSAPPASDPAFTSFFNNLPGKPDGTIRLFERNNGDYYTVHAEDAQLVAKEVYKTTTVIKYIGDLESVNLSRLNTVALLRWCLFERLWRMEVWRQEGRVWDMYRKASPGNLIEVEDLLFESGDMGVTPVVISVRVAEKGQQKLVGAAYMDATTQRILGIAEFMDDDSFGNFETLLIQLGVKEVLLPPETPVALDTVIERLSVIVTRLKRTAWTDKDVETDLAKLLTNQNLVREVYDRKVARSCAASLISYLNLLNDPSNFNTYTLHSHDFTHHLRLDANALRALHVLPNPAAPQAPSVLKLLDHCKTSIGSRLLGVWVRAPLVDIVEIKRRQDVVEAFVQSNTIRENVRSCLGTVPDTGRLARRIGRGGGLQDVVRVYQLVIKLPYFISALEEYTGPHQTIIQEMFTSRIKECASDLEKFQELVETTVDLDAVDQGEWRVQASFDAELEEMHARLQELTALLDPEARRVANMLDLEFDKKVKFEERPGLGYCLRVSRKDAGCLRGVKGITELATRKDGVYFVSGDMRRVSGEVMELRERWEKVQRGLVKSVMEVCASYLPVMEALGRVLSELDVLVAFAHVSVSAPTPYVRPEVLDRDADEFTLVQARHPLLELTTPTIPNSLQLSSSRQFLIITGPNMGGKSTYIRMAGVCAILTQLGMFLPVKSARCRVFREVFGRVGAGDAQGRGESTFMREMVEVAQILKHAGKDSLVIVDELGRGTSTYDGFGLAWGISEYIATKLQSYTLFATHFHELTYLADEVSTVQNLHVKAIVQNNEVVMLYEVGEGGADESFGVWVAKSVGFPPAVVEAAEATLKELESKAEDPHEDMDLDINQEEADAFLEFFGKWGADHGGENMGPTELQKCWEEWTLVKQNTMVS